MLSDIKIVPQHEIDEDLMSVSSPISPIAGDGNPFLDEHEPLRGDAAHHSRTGCDLDMTAIAPFAPKYRRSLMMPSAAGRRKRHVPGGDTTAGDGGSHASEKSKDKGKGRAKGKFRRLFTKFDSNRRRTPETIADIFRAHPVDMPPSAGATDPFGDEYAMDLDLDDQDEEMSSGPEEEEVDMQDALLLPSPEFLRERHGLASALGMTPPRTPARRPHSSSAATTPGSGASRKTTPGSRSPRSRRSTLRSTPGSVHSRLSQLSVLSRASGRSVASERSAGSGVLRKHRRWKEKERTSPGKATRSQRKMMRLCGLEAAGEISRQADGRVSPNELRRVYLEDQMSKIMAVGQGEGTM